jgi:hypothetical protein
MKTEDQQTQNDKLDAMRADNAASSAEKERRFFRTKPAEEPQVAKADEKVDEPPPEIAHLESVGAQKGYTIQLETMNIKDLPLRSLGIDKLGRVWAYDPQAETLTLVGELP